MASKIDEKYAALKAEGLDLGQPTGPESDAGFGGNYRTYENGNIYWHPVMGDTAHEVHGGILALYLACGGPGAHPGSGVRDFGFPLSDESTTPTDQTPFSLFEFGSIVWTPGTGGVFLSGPVHRDYWRHAGELGLPVSSLGPSQADRPSTASVASPAGTRRHHCRTARTLSQPGQLPLTPGAPGRPGAPGVVPIHLCQRAAWPST